MTDDEVLKMWGQKYNGVNGAPLKRKEISSRLIRPTHPNIQVSLMVYYARNWEQSYELDGEIVVYDEGLAQYALCDRDSHHKYYAAIMLNKPSLRCSLAKLPPHDLLEESKDNRLELIYDENFNGHDVNINGNGYMNGKTNGHGHTNGKTNSHTNGKTNSHTNVSHSNHSSPIPHLILDEDDKKAVQYLKSVLAKRGFKFLKLN